MGNTECELKYYVDLLFYYYENDFRHSATFYSWYSMS